MLKPSSPPGHKVGTAEGTTCPPLPLPAESNAAAKTRPSRCHPQPVPTPFPHPCPSPGYGTDVTTFKKWPCPRNQDGCQELCQRPQPGVCCFNCSLRRTKQISRSSTPATWGCAHPWRWPDLLCRKSPRTLFWDTCSPPATLRGKQGSQDARHTSTRSLTQIWHMCAVSAEGSSEGDRGQQVREGHTH